MNNYLNNFISGYKFSIVFSFIGSFILSTIGELILSASKESEKPLLAIMDLFPSGFKIISGIKGTVNIYNLLKELDIDKSGINTTLRAMITDKEFLRFECVTWSLWIIETIDDIINENNLNVDKKSCKILKSSSDYSILKYSTFIKVQDPSIDLIFGRQEKIDEYKENHERRIKLVEAYNSRELDFGDLSYIVIYYKNNRKEILIFVNDLGPRLRKVGLFSSERYIVEIFGGLFDRAWSQAENHDKAANNDQACDVMHVRK